MKAFDGPELLLSSFKHALTASGRWLTMTALNVGNAKGMVFRIDWRRSNQSLWCLLAPTPSGAKAFVEVGSCLFERRQLVTFPCFLLCFQLLDCLAGGPVAGGRWQVALLASVAESMLVLAQCAFTASCTVALATSASSSSSSFCSISTSRHATVPAVASRTILSSFH
jgi:hypothetical protein